MCHCGSICQSIVVCPIGTEPVEAELLIETRNDRQDSGAIMGVTVLHHRIFVGLFEENYLLIN